APRRSDVWKYKKKVLDGLITCNLCNGSIKNSGNTSNLRAHLQTHHTDIKLETIKDSNVNTTAQKRKMSTSMTTKNVFNIDLMQEEQSCDECSSPKIIKLNQESERKTFESPKSTESKKLMPKQLKVDTLFENQKSFREDLSKLKYMTLTTDAWSDTFNNVGYLGVTCHFVKDYELQSINIGVTELHAHHTSKNLKKWLLEIVEAWKIEPKSIVAVGSDNAANIKKALKDAFGEEKYLDCLAHTLNLVPTAILNSEDVKPILTKVKVIVKYFKQSNNASENFLELTKETLIQSVNTRWNSEYHMLDRFVSLSDKVVAVLLQLPKSPAMCDAEEMQTIKELIILLKPFADATNIVSGQNYITGSQAIPIIKILEKDIEKSTIGTAVGVNFQAKLKDQFKKRFEHIEIKSLIARATLLDPRFKKLYFKNKVACADAINKIYKNLRNAYANASSRTELAEINETLKSTNNDDF
ncbi:hypothetical protein TSAR_006056, partial [Trichomalopsis sarcophagae]